MIWRGLKKRLTAPEAVLERPSRLWRMQGHRDAFRTVAFRPKENTFVTSSADGTARLGTWPGGRSWDHPYDTTTRCRTPPLRPTAPGSLPAASAGLGNGACGEQVTYGRTDPTAPPR
jgi:hypothetical protein